MKKMTLLLAMLFITTSAFAKGLAPIEKLLELKDSDELVIKINNVDSGSLSDFYRRPVNFYLEVEFWVTYKVATVEPFGTVVKTIPFNPVEHLKLASNLESYDSLTDVSEISISGKKIKEFINQNRKKITLGGKVPHSINLHFSFYEDGYMQDSYLGFELVDISELLIKRVELPVLFQYDDKYGEKQSGAGFKGEIYLRSKK